MNNEYYEEEFAVLANTEPFKKVLLDGLISTRLNYYKSLISGFSLTSELSSEVKAEAYHRYFELLSLYEDIKELQNKTR